jgi:hypothetical protein
MKKLSVMTRIVTVVLVVGSLYLVLLRPSLAQGPGAEPTPTPELAPADESTPTPEPNQGNEIETHDITFKDMDYDDQKLTVNQPKTWIHFNIPGDLSLVPGLYVKLLLSHTGGQIDKPASLSIAINDHILDTVQLTAENANRSEIELDIPAEYLATGRNTLQVTFKTTWDPCARSDELPVEAVLHSEGLVHLEYEIVPRKPDLALYPVPFFELSFEPSIAHFVLPDLPTSDDMTAAATISAGLGRYSDGEIQLTSVTATEITSETLNNHHMIVIGLPEANTFLSQLSFPLSLERADIADDYGVLQEITSPWNPRRMILIVTGKSYEGLFKASAALNRQISFPSFKGQTAIIEELRVPPEDKVQALTADKTFEDLGYDDMVVYGTRASSKRVYFSLPPAWQMSDNPVLKLFLSHSDVLTNTMSTLDIHLNGVPIGSTLLNQSNSKNGLLEVELLSWLLKSGSNYIEIFVDMTTGIDECLYWTSGQVWTVISRNSTLHLPYEAQPTELDLANLFRPLTDEPNLREAFIVLPDEPSQAEQDMLLNLAARLGASVKGEYITLEVAQTDKLDPALKQTHHILAIGQPSANPLIREVNDYLPQPFLPNSDEPSQILNPAIITFDPQRSLGFVQLAASPWNPDKALLVVTGTDSEGVTAAFELLISRSKKLKGDLAMIEAGNWVTVDTRPLQVNRADEVLSVIPLDTSVFVALAERWW